MKRQSSAWLATVVLALGAFACFNDPVSDLQGNAQRVSFSKKYIAQNIHDTDVVNIQVLDPQGNPLELSGVTFTSLDPTVATMEPLPDSVLRDFPNFTLTKAIVISGNNPGRTKIAIAANGLTDTIEVVSYPTSFAGTVTATVAEGDSIVVDGTSVLGFQASTSATLGGFPLFVKSQTANRIVFWAGKPGANQNLVLSNLTFVAPIGNLTATQQVTVTTATTEPADNAPGGGRTLTVPAAVGSYVEYTGTLNGSGSNFASPGPDVDDFLTVAVGATADSVEIVVDWPASAVDIDALLYNPAITACIPANCPGASSADPEIIKARLSANTSYPLEINLWDFHSTANPPYQYRVRVYKRG